MKVICNQLRTIHIEGVEFTPIEGGVIVPEDKENAVKNSFFYKALIADGSFVVVEEKKSKS